jgi:hypothetical protein
MELRIGSLEIPTTNIGTYQKGLEDKLINAVKYNKLDVLVGPEHLFNRSNRPYTEDEADKLIRRLKAGTKGRKTLILPGTVDCFTHQTIPVLYSGKQLKSTMPLKKKGIDICFEMGGSHENGILKNSFNGEADLQIVLSCGQNIKENNVIVRPGGYLVHCDGRMPETRAYVREDSGSLTEILFSERNGTLKIYPLDF